MNLPFNAQRLDDLMDEAGVDVVLAVTKFNVQHMLGGYRYFFFANSDAIGLSRYLPAVVYHKGAPADAFYIGCKNESWGTDVFPLWVPDIQHASWSSADTARAVAEGLRRRGLAAATIAVEKAFLPADAWDILRAELPEATFVEAQKLLEGMRAVKSPDELDLLRTASEGIIDSMLATFAVVKPGQTQADIVEQFRREQTNRGMDFEYCLVSSGLDFNRAPSDRVLHGGDVLSLDSGGMYRGYVGDLSRMAVAGEPTALMTELLEEMESVQQAARTAIGAGHRGGDVFGVAEKALAECAHRDEMSFVAHGMGLITHEAPRLTGTAPVPYPGDHADLPLEAGMVLSIESWIENAEAGFIKLEDTLIVTNEGWEAPGDTGRGWNRVAAQ